MSEIGIIGLGLMGRAVATRLIGAGYAVRGCDPDAGACEGFAALGGAVCPARDVWGAEVVFSCVFDTDQLAAVIGGAPETRAVLISVSTCDPERMAGLAETAAARGITLIEAPVSGTSKSLAEGDVLLLPAGDAAVVERLGPVLDALSAQRRYVGAIGNGNRAKLAINLVLGLNRAALAEGIVFAEALGLDAGDFLSIAQASAAQSAVMAVKGRMMAERDFEPQGRIRQSAKDFGLIREGAAAAGQGLPFAETYLAMMRDAIAHGEGELDNAAVLLPIARARPE